MDEQAYTDVVVPRAKTDSGINYRRNWFEGHVLLEDAVVHEGLFWRGGTTVHLDTTAGGQGK